MTLSKKSDYDDSWKGNAEIHFQRTICTYAYRAVVLGPILTYESPEYRRVKKLLEIGVSLS